MAMERISLEELANISEDARRLRVNDSVRSIAEGAAKAFCRSCRSAAQKGNRSCSEFARDEFVYRNYIFVDRSAVEKSRNTVIEWSDFRQINEQTAEIVQDFMDAVAVFLREAGISAFTIQKVPAEPLPLVRVKTYSFFGMRRRDENVPVPSWHVLISAKW